ncbi:MAG: hypothetical protein M1133_00835 [Armatimonadetes bacterium]|nr:hypothetical protein [Armatimonadota bacterium]
MVAVLAVLTITILILVDWSLQLVQARCAQRRASNQHSQPWSQRVLDPFNPPMGIFFHPGHSWALVEPSGCIRVGLDGLVGFLLGYVDRVQLPSPGQHVREGESIACLLQGSRELRLVAPVDGTVVQVNRELAPDGLFIWSEPYGAGWICEIKPESLSKDLRKLMIADQAVEWHTEESRRMRAFCSHNIAHEAGTKTVEPQPSSLRGFLQDASDEQWREFESRFLKPERGGNGD